MTDPYPQNFPIEIEHDKLCRYLRTAHLIGWGSLLVVFASMIGIMAHTGEHNRANINSMSDVWREFFLGLGIGAASGVILALIVYVPLHFLIKKEADGLCVSVEGQFLHIVQGRSFRRDRKIHFRAIVDYACFQGPLMRRCGITGIMMHTMAGSQGAVIRILAVKDAERIRDVLSDVDRLRENLEPA
jgi:membrane protein YdbS with pleckstrin-like domain